MAPRRRHRRDRSPRATAQLDEALLYGPDIAPPPPGGETALRDAWRRDRPRLLAATLAETWPWLPWAWWRFDAGRFLDPSGRVDPDAVRRANPAAADALRRMPPFTPPEPARDAAALTGLAALAIHQPTGVGSASTRKRPGTAGTARGMAQQEEA